MEYEKTNNNLFDDSKSKNISKERILLEWTNINYSIVTKKKKKKIHPIDNENLLGQPVIENEQNGEINQPTDIINDPDTKLILRNIQGFAAPYELLAIMGPSGRMRTRRKIRRGRRRKEAQHHKILYVAIQQNVVQTSACMKKKKLTQFTSLTK